MSLNSIIDSLPFECHFPRFQYLGPGTDLKKRLAKGDKGINLLDEAALKHDLAYARNENRRAADDELIDFAFKRIAAKNADPEERAAALVTACCMVSKVTLEKFFCRIGKAFGAKKKKKKNKIISKNVDQKRQEKAARTKKISRKNSAQSVL